MFSCGMRANMANISASQPPSPPYVEEETMSETIVDKMERVAKAMWKSAVPNNPWDGALDDDYYDGPGRVTMRKMALAAIKEMESPHPEGRG